MATVATSGAQGAYQRNITLYTILELCNATAYVAGNWIYFWLRVMTYGQIGLVDALSFGFGMLMEIPTGAIADLVGKRYTLLLAMVFNALGWAAMATSETLFQLVAGFWLVQIAQAFYSGANQALLYDSLKEMGSEASFDRTLSRITNLVIPVLIVTMLAGGWMYEVDFRFPHVAWVLSFMVGMVAAVFITEPPSNAPHFSLRNYAAQLLAGFQQLGVPALKPHLLQILLTRGARYMFSMGLITPLMAIGFGFDARGQSVLWAFLLVGEMIGYSIAPWLRRRGGDANALVIAGVCIGIGYAAGALPLGLLGGVMMVLLRVGGGIADLVGATVINDSIPSETRATTLSTVALFVRLPYVLCGVIAGETQQSGSFWLFCLVFGGGMLLTSALYGLTLRRTRIVL